VRNNIIVRLVAYYLAVIVALGVLAAAFPVLGDYLAAERARQGGRASLDLDRASETVRAAPGVTGPADLLDPERTVPIVLSLAIALAVALPVVWVYGWTRPRRRHSQSFAQTLLVVPIAITLVVFLVKGSLALAFSLAGIVAAVRFRTSLDDPMDGVYLFIVIGIGLAAGVQLLFVAFIASLVFNAVALTVWRLKVGSQPAVLDGWRLVPAAPAVPIADPGIARPAPGPAAEEPRDRYNARLRLHTSSADESQRRVTPLLQVHTKQWRVAEVAQEPDGTSSVVDFEIRLGKSVDLAAFVKEVEAAVPHVTRVELTRMKKPKDE
jgi:hypothetical protein